MDSVACKQNLHNSGSEIIISYRLLVKNGSNSIFYDPCSTRVISGDKNIWTCALQPAECGLVNPACEPIYLQSISPSHVSAIGQLLKTDSGLEMHGLHLGLDKMDLVSATPSFLS